MRQHAYMGAWRRWGVVLAVAWLALGPGMAAADANLDQAKALVTEGGKLFAAGHHAEALDRYRRAQALRPSDKLLFNIGLCELELGHEPAAAESFDAFLTATAAKPDAVAANRKIAREKLDKLSRTLIRQELRVEPAGAALRLDGEPVTPGPHYLRRGVGHRLEATTEGFAPRSREIPADAPAGLQLLTLEAAKPAPEPAKPPEAAPERADVPAHVELAPPARADTAALSASTPKRGNHVPSYIAWGAALALAGAGTYFGLQEMRLAQTVPASCTTAGLGAPGCDDYPALHRDATAATWLFVGAGAAAAAGGVLWLLAPETSTNPETP